MRSTTCARPITSAHLVLAGHDEHALLPGLLRRLSAHAVVGSPDRRRQRTRQMGAAARRRRDGRRAPTRRVSASRSSNRSPQACRPSSTRTCPWSEIEQRAVRSVGRTERAGDRGRASPTRGRSGGTAPDGGARGRVRSGTIRLGRDRARDVAPLRRAALIVSVILLTPNLSGADGISTVARLVTRACDDVTVLALHEADRTTFDEVDVEGSGGRSSHFVTAATRWAVSADSAGDRHRHPPASRAGGAGLRGARRLAVDDCARRRGVEAAHLAAACGARPQRTDCRRLGVFARSVSCGQSPFRAAAHRRLPPRPRADRDVPGTRPSGCLRRSSSAGWRATSDTKGTTCSSISGGMWRRTSRAPSCVWSATATTARGSSRRPRR